MSEEKPPGRENRGAMKIQTKIPFFCYVLVFILSLSFALIYLVRAEFMPYHAGDWFLFFLLGKKKIKSKEA